MSAPIKPTGGGSAPSGVEDGAGPGEAHEASVGVHGPSEVSPGATPSLEGVSHALSAVAEDLRRGQIDPSHALDAVIDRVLESVPVSAPLRVEIEAHLRRAFEDDPSLAGLLADLAAIR